MAEIVKNDGESCASDEVIAKIDTEGEGEGRARPQSQRRALRRLPPHPCRGASGGQCGEGDVAMPAAAKLMADNKLAAGSVAGTGKDGRVTKGDVLSGDSGRCKGRSRDDTGGRAGGADAAEATATCRSADPR